MVVGVSMADHVAMATAGFHFSFDATPTLSKVIHTRFLRYILSQIQMIFASNYLCFRATSPMKAQPTLHLTILREQLTQECTR